MGYNIRFSQKFDKQFSKLDHTIQKFIFNWIQIHLEGIDTPRTFGKSLKGNKAGLWRYRVGGYRLICEIIDNKLIILVLTVGHRREIYKK